MKESYQLLEKEELFISIRKEIKQDLGKLRPYQILELFNKEELNPEQKDKAIGLLQEMLDARGGIESQEMDESGLNVDGFLRFIQQIRVYLTSAEQQELFEIEAQRPSHGAAYLAACACIARGVTQKKPELIIKAKNNLISLTIHQDVYLEQSICALLLGQTAESEFSLTQSKESEVIEYIKDISSDSPDFLPGLCRYTEKWLQTEIFPQFKDLQDKTASLQEYFADPSVQHYLDNLSPPLQEVETDSSEVSSGDLSPEQGATTATSDDGDLWADDLSEVSTNDDRDEVGDKTPQSEKANKENSDEEFRPSLLLDVELISDSQPSLTELLADDLEFGHTSDLSGETSPEIEAEATSDFNLDEFSSATDEETESKFASYLNDDNFSNSILEEPTNDSEIANLSSSGVETPEQPIVNDIKDINDLEKIPTPDNTPVTNSEDSEKVGNKVIWLMLITLISFVALGFVTWQYLFKSQGKTEKLLEISLHEPVIDLPSEQTSGGNPPPDQNQNKPIDKLNNETALILVNRWLQAKSEATGSNYNINLLKQILTPEQASLWIANSQNLKKDRIYRRYNHKVQIFKVQVNPSNSNKGTIRAKVEEKSQYYQNNKLQESESYEDSLIVDYFMIKINNQWVIESIKVVNQN